MIKQLTIKNYKSLKDVTLKLGMTNVLVGPNMSGKSNIIDCLKFITQITVHGVGRAILDRGGSVEVAWKGEDSGPISFHLIVELMSEDKKSKKLFDYHVSISSALNGFSGINLESLKLISDEKSSVLISVKNGKGKGYHLDGSKAFTLSDSSKSFLEYSVPDWEGNVFKNYISSFRFYNLIPTLMKKPSEASHQNFLTEHGENLSSWFLTLSQTNSEEFKMIRQVAADALPELKEILTPPTQMGGIYISSVEKHLNRKVGIQHMSDGEVVFLALLSLIFAPPEFSAPLFCVEELENHLHPRLIETLIEGYTQRRDALGDEAAQVILTTHSPYLVDKMNIEDIIVVERKDGATQCSHPSDKKHLKELIEREELGLGELWYSGSLGG